VLLREVYSLMLQECRVCRSRIHDQQASTNVKLRLIGTCIYDHRCTARTLVNASDCGGLVGQPVASDFLCFDASPVYIAYLWRT
jgi:hypothetical protein